MPRIGPGKGWRIWSLVSVGVEESVPFGGRRCAFPPYACWHRMRIEQSFRDLKNERTGLGLSASRSRSGQRLEILLLIGHLATWVMRLIGECAQQCQMHLHFQSTCRLNRKEISVLTLARRVIDAGSTWIGRLHPKEALTLLRDQAWQACHGF